MSASASRSTTKARLRDHALDLVATRGMSALSVRTLCKGVGIRESSFYAHFSSKEALLDDLLQAAGADTPKLIGERLQQLRLPMMDFVPRLIRELLELWTDPLQQKHRALLESEAARSPELRERFNNGVRGMIDCIAQELQRGVMNGELDAHASSQVMAWSLVAPVAALRSTLLAFGAPPDHVTEGVTLAHAHADGWLRAHRTRSVS